MADHINQICHFFADPRVSFKAITNSPGSHYCFNEAKKKKKKGGGEGECDKCYSMWIERYYHSLTTVSEVFAGKPWTQFQKSQKIDRFLTVMAVM
jgi:hypothetical protein